VQPRLLVVGGGRMGAALVRGLCSAGWEPGAVTVAEVDAARRRDLVSALPGATVVGAPVPAEGAVLAVKPSVAEPACRALAEVEVPRWLSIMAGVPLANLEAWAGPTVAVVRAMPNTPALVRAGISAVAGGSRASETDLDWAEALLGAVGQVVRVDERDLHAVTAVSGSGPAYVFLFAEALAEAGMGAGLPEALARRLAIQTVAGAGRLLGEPGAEPADLRAQVTSPGGTTEAAVDVLDRQGLRAILGRAVAAAAERSREMAAEQG
jgi:pyrroline-5-carboxylate reductase